MSKGSSIEAQLAVILEDYSKDLQEKANEAGQKLAKECANEIKANSPRNRPEYYKGWTYRADRGFNGSTMYTIYNKTHPGLTHLLEKGHDVPGKGKRTGAQAHIKPAEVKYNALYEEAMKEAAENAGN